jgi:hypothetical protein
MDKLVKKIGSILLMLCLTVSLFPLSAFAADGTLQFSDPSAKAGDSVTVTVKAESGTSAIGDVDVTVTYDTSILKFVSGTNATGGDGTLQLSAQGDGTASEVTYSLEFTALKEGTATLQASAYTAYLYNNDALNLSAGTSTVTVQGGTAVTDTESDSKENKASSGSLQVDVDGETYSINENFSEAAIPKGFTATDMELDGTTTKAMQQETSGQYMFYLDDSEGKSDYFLYSTDDGSFSPTSIVDVNSEVSIYLMNHKDTEGLPSEYQETTTDIEGKIFSAWQNTSQQEYYLVYALSSDGNKGYYQYDTTEGTYQRYVAPVIEKQDSTNNLSDKVVNFLEKHLILVMCVLWGTFLLLLIIMIVLGVKLSRRNQELDDLYEEYGLDDDDGDDNTPIVKKKSREQFAGFDEEDNEDEYDDFEQYDDEEYDDFDEYEEDEYEDDEDEYQEEYEEKPARKSKKKQDDDYSMDFIDI